MENRVEKTVGAVKERSLSLAHSFTGRRRFNDEDALLDGWVHRETSVQGDRHLAESHLLGANQNTEDCSLIAELRLCSSNCLAALQAL